MISEVSMLSELRSEVDHIDDNIHDLLIRRAKVVEKIGEAKQKTSSVYLNPAREAQVLRRLVSRHNGRLPKAVIIRLWRELFGALVGLQGPFSLAVYTTKCQSSYLDLARDQYGAYTPTTVYGSAKQVIRAVMEGSATVGILPMPQESEQSPWWQILTSNDIGNPKIVARLPFVEHDYGQLGERIEAVAVACIVPEPSGRDNTFFSLETPNNVSQDTVKQVIYQAGLQNPIYRGFYIRNNRLHFHLVDVTGFITNSDERLQALCCTELSNVRVNQILILGGYAVPFSHAEIAESSLF